jgi:hypothetical protein
VRYEQHFTLDQMVANTVRLYHEVLGSPKRPLDQPSRVPTGLPA